MTAANAQGTVYYSLENDLTTGTCSSSRGSTTIPTGTNAGSYTVYYCTTGNSNYNAKSGSVNVTIGQFDISSGTIGSVSAQNYSGSAIKPTPAVSVTINGSSKTLTATTEYTYSYTSNTNPTNAAKVTATGTGNYKGTLTQTFTIKPRVTFAANGGSGTMSAQHVNYNSATALTENAFTRTGYKFAGWNTAADGSGTSYADKANITTTSNVTLNAQWSACGAGTYLNGNTCSTCPAGTYSSGIAHASCTNCTAGYYCEAGSTSATQHECAAGKYCPAGTSDTTIKTCPTADSGWTATSPAKSTAVTACYEYQTPTNCSSGSVKRAAKSDGSGYDTTITLNETLKAKANYYTTTTATSCTACPTNYGTSAANTNSGTSAANTNSGASACYLTTASGKFVSTANAAPVDCTAGGYCPGSVQVNYGSTGGRTACPTADSGWTATSPAKSTAYSACYEYQTPTNCSSGSVKRAASSATAYSTTITLNETLKATANYYTTTTATSCTACPTNYGTSAANTNSGASA